MSLSRRQLFGVGSGLYGLLLGRNLQAQDEKPLSPRQDLEEVSEVFRYGVASGDPLHDRVILWTQVDNQNAKVVSVDWQAALDPYFMEVVSEGETYALAQNDYTVKIDALLPDPGTTYFYRFRAHGYWSPVGRTRTAPLKAEHLRIAVASCSSIWSGYFNSYEMLSKRGDLDLIVHCGDYAYDVPDKDEMRNLSFFSINQKDPGSLSEHRQRYRYYRLDPHLRAAHQQHPWAVVWDNHDICTSAPREESIQAFMEWLPVRVSPKVDRIYRSLDFGDLLKIILLDTRHIGRDTRSSATNESSILGDTQFSWLENELKTSTSQWNIIVNQVLLSPFQVLGKPLAKDSWSGFPKDRERLLRFISDEGLSNTIVVSGDAHLSYACNLEIDGKYAGVEFLPSSVTRGNLDETLSSFLAGLVKGSFEAAVKFFNPSIRYFESEEHGYGIVDLTKESANCEFWYVDHRELTNVEVCKRSLSTRSGANYFTDEHSSRSVGKSLCPRLAPPEERLFEKGLEVGGQGGDFFDGLERLQKFSRLAAVSLQSEDRIMALSCNYRDGLSWKKGGSGGKEQSLELRDDEYIRSMTVGIGKHQGKVLVTYIKLETCQGRVLEGGKSTKDLVVFNAPKGKHIASFFGRSGKLIDKLGPVFAPDFDSNRG